MGPGVDGQSAALNEALVTVLDCTMIRSFIGVNPVMATKI